MMTAIISDVHGNYPALKSVLKVLDDMECTRILSLGDVAGYYCMINECLDEFRKRGIINLLGNHDAYLLGFRQCVRSVTVNRCIAFQRSLISAENYEYLKKCPLSFEDDTLSARHGGWTDPIDEYIDAFDFGSVRDSRQRIYCSGHTHKQKLQEQSGKIYFNPGSVGQPRDGDPRAAYAVLDGETVSLHRVEYPIDVMVQAMSDSGFESRIADCLYYGAKIEPFKRKNEEKLSGKS